MTHSGMLYQLDIFAFFFFSASDLCPLEIYEKLGLSLSSITFTANNHVDNHFYQCVYLFQIIHNLESVFFVFFHRKTLLIEKKGFILVTM